MKLQIQEMQYWLGKQPLLSHAPISAYSITATSICDVNIYLRTSSQDILVYIGHVTRLWQCGTRFDIQQQKNQKQLPSPCVNKVSIYLLEENLREEKRKGERRSPIYWLVVQIPAIVETKAGCQEPRPGSPALEAGTPLPDPWLLPLKICIARKLESGARQLV